MFPLMEVTAVHNVFNMCINESGLNLECVQTFPLMEVTAVPNVFNMSINESGLNLECVQCFL